MSAKLADSHLKPSEKLKEDLMLISNDDGTYDIVDNARDAEADADFVKRLDEAISGYEKDESPIGGVVSFEVETIANSKTETKANKLLFKDIVILEDELLCDIETPPGTPVSSTDSDEKDIDNDLDELENNLLCDPNDEFSIKVSAKTYKKLDDKPITEGKSESKSDDKAEENPPDDFDDILKETADELYDIINETKDTGENIVPDATVASIYGNPEIPPSAPPAKSTKQAIKELVPFRIKFLTKFSSPVAVLTRSELEELLIKKIKESMSFCSENTELADRIEKQEKNLESLQIQLQNVKKQYNDLVMLYRRAGKDLQDNPDSGITLVKITRNVGLQVFSLGSTENNNKLIMNNETIKPSNKRPATEFEKDINERSNISPENLKRMKATQLRPALSNKKRQINETKAEQKIRKTVSSVKVPAKHVISHIPNGQGPSRSDTHSNTHSSMDLTDD